MKNIILLILLLFCFNMYGQVKPWKPKVMTQGLVYLDKKNANYNPATAFVFFKGYAERNNAYAMNVLGTLYRDGIGTTANQPEAIKWFEQSAEGGCEYAYYNLADIYRKGWGLKQDFAVAYEIYERGALNKCFTCLYWQGYMLYKGLGVSQNYQKAIAIFKKDIRLNSLGSMYMLGLCYRNGYGITQNADSAHYWLSKAASKGYRSAIEELLVPVPEILSDQLSENNGKSGMDQTKASSISAGKVGKYPIYQLVKNTAKLADIIGEYSGFVTRYDYSGKLVIGNTPLRLKLEAQDNTITGSYIEGSSLVVNLQAEMTDSSLVFNNSAFMAANHYSAGKLDSYFFKNGTLQVLRQKDSMYMVGNLHLWTATLNEPDIPIYISLTKTSSAIKPGISVQEPIKVKTLPVSELKVYPNPFTNNFQLSFSLDQQSSVEISIADLSGRIVYREPTKSMAPGKYNFGLQPKLQRGAYLLTVNCNGQVKSTVIINQ